MKTGIKRVLKGVVIALVMGCLRAYALTPVVYSAERFTGTPNNRSITIALLTQGILHGTNGVFDTPHTYQPTNGVVVLGLRPANYTLQIDQLDTLFPFGVPDSTNTYSIWDLVARGIYVLTSGSNAVSLVAGSNVVLQTISPGVTRISATGGVSSNDLAGASNSLFSAIQAAAGAAGVVSWNNRTGMVTLSSNDVTAALGYVPGSGSGAWVEDAGGKAATNLAYLVFTNPAAANGTLWYALPWGDSLIFAGGQPGDEGVDMANAALALNTNGLVSVKSLTVAEDLWVTNGSIHTGPNLATAKAAMRADIGFVGTAPGLTNLNGAGIQDLSIPTAALNWDAQEALARASGAMLSFQGRTNPAATLTSADVTGALGYVPWSSSVPVVRSIGGLGTSVVLAWDTYSFTNGNPIPPTTCATWAS